MPGMNATANGKRSFMLRSGTPAARRHQQMTSEPAPRRSACCPRARRFRNTHPPAPAATSQRQFPWQPAVKPHYFQQFFPFRSCRIRVSSSGDRQVTEETGRCFSLSVISTTCCRLKTAFLYFVLYISYIYVYGNNNNLQKNSVTR